MNVNVRLLNSAGNIAFSGAVGFFSAGFLGRSIGSIGASGAMGY